MAKDLSLKAKFDSLSKELEAVQQTRDALAQRNAELQNDLNAAEARLERAARAAVLDSRSAEGLQAAAHFWRQQLAEEVAQTMGRGAVRAKHDPVYRVMRELILSGSGWQLNDLFSRFTQLAYVQCGQEPNLEARIEHLTEEIRAGHEAQMAIGRRG